MSARPSAGRRLATAVLMALATGSGSAGEQALIQRPDPIRFASALRAAIPEALQGDAGRAVALYRKALAEVDSGLPIDKATGVQLVTGLLHAYERSGRAGEAIDFLESMPAHPNLAGPWQAHLCRLYLKRHALDKAEAACLQASEEEALRSAAAPASQTVMLGRVLAIRQSLFEIGNAVQDPFSAVLRQADSGGNTAFSKPEVSFLRTLSPYSLLAQVHFERADAVALAGLYRGGFAAHAARIGAQLEGALPATGYVPLEDDHARFGALLAGLDTPAEAEQALRTSLALNAARTRFIASQYNPALLAGTLASRRAKADLYASAVLRRAMPERQALASMAGELMQAKGVLSELLAIRHRFIERSGEPDLIDLYHRAEFAAAGGDEAQWKAAALQLDRKNLAWLPDSLFDAGTSFTARVGARLGTRTLVSVIRHTPFDFRTQAFGVPHYLALRIKNGDVKVRDIGTVDELDLMVQRYRAEMGDGQDAASAQGARKLGRHLYAKILAPVLGERLPEGDYVADMDGMLNLLPLEALTDASGRYLVEVASWRYVSSARTLLRDPAPATAAEPAALLLVDPAFSAAPAPAGMGNAALRTLPLAAAGLGRFQPLPETREEGRAVSLAIARLGVPATVLSGTEAVPAALSAVRAPRFLHIATHGFVLESESPVVPGMMSSAAASGGMAGGIALAGANADDGHAHGAGLFFTSQFRSLDLNGTELVVMSACDTGVGSVRAGEGLNSLRQSLELAGARAQVTAVWKVPSAATVRLMERFYDNLAGGTSKAEALRRAKLDLMKAYPDPVNWAGFTLSGESD